MPARGARERVFKHRRHIGRCVAYRYKAYTLYSDALPKPFEKIIHIENEMSLLSDRSIRIVTVVGEFVYWIRWLEWKRYLSTTLVHGATLSNLFCLPMYFPHRALVPLLLAHWIMGDDDRQVILAVLCSFLLQKAHLGRVVRDAVINARPLKQLPLYALNGLFWTVWTSPLQKLSITGWQHQNRS